MTDAYTKVELKELGDEFPKKGIYCPKCKTFIPIFAELSKDDEIRLKEKIKSEGGVAAIKELCELTGCSLRLAKIWVVHPEGPTPVIDGPPCPYCGGKLRTSRAKQCPHCLKSWRNES